MYKFYVLKVILFYSTFTLGQLYSVEKKVKENKTDTLKTEVLENYKYGGYELICDGDGINLMKYLFSQGLCSSPLREVYITDFFGWRSRHPVTNKARMHNGLDLRCKFQNVYAAVPGRITEIGWENGLGNYLRLKIFELEFTYGHLSDINVAVGDIVKNGDVIAISGDSGKVTGPHLHLELTNDKVRLNPIEYIEYLFAINH